MSYESFALSIISGITNELIIKGIVNRLKYTNKVIPIIIPNMEDYLYIPSKRDDVNLSEIDILDSDDEEDEYVTIDKYCNDIPLYMQKSQIISNKIYKICNSLDNETYLLWPLIHWAANITRKELELIPENLVVLPMFVFRIQHILKDSYPLSANICFNFSNMIKRASLEWSKESKSLLTTINCLKKIIPNDIIEITIKYNPLLFYIIRKY